MQFFYQIVEFNKSWLGEVQSLHDEEDDAMIMVNGNEIIPLFQEGDSEQQITSSVDEAISLENQMEMNEMDTSLWVHKDVMKMSKTYGVDFHGCEKEALALFLKMDRSRQIKRIKTLICRTPRPKGIQEVKNLICYGNPGQLGPGLGGRLLATFQHEAKPDFMEC